MSISTQSSRHRAREVVLVDVDRACRLLGGISRATLYRMIARGDLLPCRVGSRTMFDTADLSAYAAVVKDRRPAPRRAA